LARYGKKDFHCTHVSEDVKITLISKSHFSSKSNLVVKCDQIYCQYVELNKPPCPLSIDLFSDEIPKSS